MAFVVLLEDDNESFAFEGNIVMGKGKAAIFKFSDKNKMPRFVKPSQIKAIMRTDFAAEYAAQSKQLLTFLRGDLERN